MGNDYRKIRFQNKDGNFEVIYMDDFIDSLLREERYCDVILPRLQKRQVLEEANEIEPRVSDTIITGIARIWTRIAGTLRLGGETTTGIAGIAKEIERIVK